MTEIYFFIETNPVAGIIGSSQNIHTYHTYTSLEEAVNARKDLVNKQSRDFIKKVYSPVIKGWV